MSSDLASVLQDLCYCGNSTCRYCGYARQAREMQAEIVRLRAAGDALADALRAETVNGAMACFNETFKALNVWQEARREQ